jgi:predicted transcriptional regulator
MDLLNDLNKSSPFYYLYSMTLKDDNDKVLEIPDAHLADIEQGMQDIKNGDFLTLEELEKRYGEYLQ